jgi:hypothetical protein
MSSVVPLASLWLPIVLSTVLVFAASSIIWMVLPHHKHDLLPVTYEGELTDALSRQHLAPGFYGLPRARSAEEMRSAEFQKRMESGPVAYITVAPSRRINMGRSLALWFVYLLVISISSAYITSRTVPPGADYLHVFRVAGTFAVFAYAAGHIPAGVFWSRPWSIVWKDVLDCIIYGLLTAGTFGWLWPR